MNHKQLIEAFATESAIKKDLASELLTHLENVIKSELAVNEIVKFGSIGTFKTRQMKERKARNPKNGEAVIVPPRTKIVFVASKELKSDLNH